LWLLLLGPVLVCCSRGCCCTSYANKCWRVQLQQLLRAPLPAAMGSITAVLRALLLRSGLNSCCIAGQQESGLYCWRSLFRTPLQACASPAAAANQAHLRPGPAPQTAAQLTASAHWAKTRPAGQPSMQNNPQHICEHTHAKTACKARRCCEHALSIQALLACRTCPSRHHQVAWGACTLPQHTETCHMASLLWLEIG
jgi:hypothetical protein